MTDLESHLGKQIAAAERTDRVRESFLDRYLGEKYGDEVEGRSEVVTSEVFDVVESIAAEMMDVLTSADRIATFRPRGRMTRRPQRTRQTPATRCSGSAIPDSRTCKRGSRRG